MDAPLVSGNVVLFIRRMLDYAVAFKQAIVHTIGPMRPDPVIRRVSFWVFSSICWAVAGGAPDVVAAPLNLSSALSVSEQYDSNIYLSQTDPIGDLATTVSPQISVAFDSRDVQGALRYQATAERYRRRSEANRWSQQADLNTAMKGIKRLIRGLDVQMTGSYSLADDIPDAFPGDSGLEPVGVILLPKTETTQWRGGITAAYAWTRRLETRLEYGFTETRYDAFDLSELADVIGGTPALSIATHNSVMHDATLRFRYRWSPSWTATLNPGWSAIRVDPAAGAASTATDTRATRRVSIGAEYSGGPAWSASGEIGVTAVEDDQARVVVDVDLQRGWKQGRVALTAGQEIGAGGGVTDTASILQRLGANASHALGAKVQVSLRLDYSRNVSLPRDPLIRSIRIQTYRAGGGATYRMLGWLDGSVDYSYFVQDSAGIAVDGKRHVVTFALTARAPGWRLFD